MLPTAAAKQPPSAADATGYRSLTIPTGERNRPMARFVRDITSPDGTQVPAAAGGTQFLKTWRIRNDGDVAWPAQSVPTFSGGDVLEHVVVTSEVPSADPGEEVDISVAIIAPEAEGRYVIYFRICTPQGQLFGQRFWCDFRVVPPSEFNPTSEQAQTDSSDTPGGASREGEGQCDVSGGWLLVQQALPAALEAFALHMETQRDRGDYPAPPTASAAGGGSNAPVDSTRSESEETGSSVSD